MSLKIPTSQGPEVSPTVAPRARQASAPDFGGGQAAQRAYGQARGLAGDASDIILREEMRAQEAEFNELSILADRAEMARKEALSKVQGKEALQASQDALADFDKDAESIGGRASSRAVSERLKVRMERNRLGLEATGNHHARQEAEKYEAQEFHGLRESTVNKGATAYRDPLQILMADDELTQIHRRNGALTGKAPALIERELAEDTSALHSGVIMQFMRSGDDRSARAYYEKNEGLLIARDQIRLGAQVSRNSTIGEAQRLGTQFMEQAGDVRVEANRLAAGVEDAELRKATEEFMDVQYGRQDRAERIDYGNNLKKMYDMVEQNFIAGNSAEEVVGVERFSKLDSKDRASLQQVWRQVNGLDVSKTDDSVMYALKMLGANPETRQEFLSTNLLEYRSKLTKTDFDQMVEYQTTLSKGDTVEADGFLSKEQLIASSANSIKNKKDRETFRQAVDREIGIWRKAPGNEKKGLPPKEEIQKIIDDLVKDGGWFTNKNYTLPVEEYRAVQKAEAFKQNEIDIIEDMRFQGMVDKIPPQELEQIVEAIGRRNVYPSNARIIEAFDLMRKKSAESPR